MRQGILSIRVMFAVIIATAVIAATSCKKKKEENHNVKFIGTWHLSGMCNVMGFGTDTTDMAMMLSAGTDGNTLLFKVPLGSDSICLKEETLKLTASGNNITMASQTFTDGCGVSNTISGTGSLTGDVMTFSMTYVQSTFPIPLTCTFTGKK